MFKLVYSHWIDREGEKYPLANGLHPATVEYIQNAFLLDQMNINPLTLKIAEIDSKWSSFDQGIIFRHTDFMLYFLKHFSMNQIVSEDDIVNDDDTTYLFPIEMECNFEKVLYNSRTFKFSVNGVDYDYLFQDTLTPAILNGFKTGKVKLLLINMADPLMENSEINALQRALMNVIRDKNIIFLQGNIRYDYRNKYTRPATMVGSMLSLTQNAELLDRYPVTSGLNYTSDIVREADLDVNVIRDKKFICFNRFMNRPHRIAVCYLALKYNLLEQGYFSFITDLHRDSLKLLKGFFDDENLEEADKKIKSLVPYEIDTQHLSPEQKKSFYPIDNNKKELYQNSYVHITSETQFNEYTSPFFSEKTWRPIMNLQPFIFIGNPGSLEKLRELGFKTFHPFINESYDLIKNDRQRFLALEQEIKKFSEMPIEEIHSWYYSILNTLIHNRDHLRTFKNYNPMLDLFTQKF